MKTATFFFSLLIFTAKRVQSALPDKCPVVTLPEVTGENEGDGTIDRCLNMCRELIDGCAFVAGDPLNDAQPGGISSPIRFHGGCIGSPLGTAPPADRMVSSAIIEPGSDIVNGREGVLFEMAIVRTRNFYNVMYDFVHHALRPAEFKFPQSIASQPSWSNFAPMLSGGTLTAGYVIWTANRFGNGKYEQRRDGRNLQSAIMHRTSWDRDTHYARVRNPPSAPNFQVRRCVKLMTVLGSALLHPVAKHGPVGDCIWTL